MFLRHKQLSCHVAETTNDLDHISYILVIVVKVLELLISHALLPA